MLPMILAKLVFILKKKQKIPQKTNLCKCQKIQINLSLNSAKMDIKQMKVMIHQLMLLKTIHKHHKGNLNSKIYALSNNMLETKTWQKLRIYNITHLLLLSLLLLKEWILLPKKELSMQKNRNLTKWIITTSLNKTKMMS